jgi:hypothetical protein
MRLIIEARVEGAESDQQSNRRAWRSLTGWTTILSSWGLTLEEGRELLPAAQSALVPAVDAAPRCTTKIVDRSLYARYLGKSGCRVHDSGPARAIFSPLSEGLPKRITPELEYLQVKWAAHLPYAASTALLKEVLPLHDCISTTGAKARIRVAGTELDTQIEREIAEMPPADIIADAIESSEVTAVSVDSAWLKHCGFSDRKSNRSPFTAWQQLRHSTRRTSVSRYTRISPLGRSRTRRVRRSYQPKCLAPRRYRRQFFPPPRVVRAMPGGPRPETA